MSGSVKIWVEGPRFGWGFVLLWIAANALVPLAAIAAFTASGVAVTDAILPDPAAMGEASGFAGLVGLAAALLVSIPLTALAAGFLQWLVLRWYVPWAGRWAAVTIPGLILGLIAGISVGRGALGWAVIGALMGTAQWLVIRRRIGNAHWWIVVSALGLCLGNLLTPNRLVISGVVMTGLVRITISLLGPALAWAILGGITLRALSQQPPRAV